MTLWLARRVSRGSGLTTLGAVPLQDEAKDHQNRLVMVDNPHSSAAEAYRVLRTNLQLCFCGSAACSDAGDESASS